MEYRIYGDFLLSSLMFSFISSRLNTFVTYNNDSLGQNKSLPDLINYFKEHPFYNRYTEKPKHKRLKNIDLFSELPFYEELNVIKTDRVFKGYGMLYNVELVPLIQLEVSKSSIKDLFNE